MTTCWASIEGLNQKPNLTTYLINFEQKSQEAILLYHVNRNKTTDDKVLPNIFPRRAPVMNDFFSPHFVLCRVALFLQFAVRSSDE